MPGRVQLQAEPWCFRERRLGDHPVRGKKSRRPVDTPRIFAVRSAPLLDKYLLPKLGTKRLSTITYESVTAITDKLSGRPSETVLGE